MSLKQRKTWFQQVKRKKKQSHTKSQRCDKVLQIAGMKPFFNGNCILRDVKSSLTVFSK